MLVNVDAVVAQAPSSVGQLRFRTRVLMDPDQFYGNLPIRNISRKYHISGSMRYKYDPKTLINHLCILLKMYIFCLEMNKVRAYGRTRENVKYSKRYTEHRNKWAFLHKIR